MKLLKQHLDNEFGVNLTKALSVPDHLVRLSGVGRFTVC